MKNRITFKLGNTIQVFRLGITSNTKIIADRKEKILQIYTFSINQFDYIENCINTNTKPVMKEFFNLDKDCCLDCPLSNNSGNGKCYVHKYIQYTGLLSMVKSIIKEYKTVNNIPAYHGDIIRDIRELADNKYIRLGTYGEPVLHPLDLVKNIIYVAKSYTGYTHQYKNCNSEFGKWLMASTHSENENSEAKETGFHAFMATLEHDTASKNIICPASKESNYKTSCSDCKLCSGTSGNSIKNIAILEH